MPVVDLPDVTFVSDDVATTLSNLITAYEAIANRTLQPSDPVRLFLFSIAAVIVQQRTLINLASRANLLKYAGGDMLDHMGAFADTARLPASAASTILRFTLSAPQLSAVTIPAGTRASTDSDPKRYFETTTVAQINPGGLIVDVLALCTESGTLGNGYMPGTINQIVDPIAFVTSSVNTTTSTGGADIEDDESYRERIHSAPESFSVAGPTGAYKHWAMSASASITDVAVFSPAPTEVVVVPLLEGGEIPGSGLLSLVEDAVNDRTRRPLTDSVTVQAPTAVPFAVELEYWISQERASETVALQTAVAEAVTAYVLWQKSKLGRRINPSELIRRVMQAGAHRAQVNSPVYTEIDPDEVAIAGTPDVTYGGLIDD